MNVLQLYLSIAGSIAAGLLQNKDNPGKVGEWIGYLNFASALVARYTAGNAAIAELDEQLKDAVAAGRGLTSDQRTAWHSRDDVATEVARQWLADHPKSGVG